MSGGRSLLVLGDGHLPASPPVPPPLSLSLPALPELAVLPASQLQLSPSLSARMRSTRATSSGVSLLRCHSGVN